jgi:hypothetical protein
MRVFTLVRTPPGGEQCMMCLVKLSTDDIALTIEIDQVAWGSEELTGIISGETMIVGAGGLLVELRPYQVRWIREYDARG